MPTDETRAIRVEGSADLAFVDSLLDEVDRLWEKAPAVPDDDRLLFALAVSEIATNMAEHSPVGARIEAEVTASSAELRATLHDTAPPADVELTAEMPGAEAESGRGLALSRSVLDELSHRASADGNAWTLVRHLRL